MEYWINSWVYVYITLTLTTAYLLINSRGLLDQEPKELHLFMILTLSLFWPVTTLALLIGGLMHSINQFLIKIKRKNNMKSVYLVCIAAMLTAILFLLSSLVFDIHAGPVVDTDEDGIINELDNCLVAVNFSQCDTDSDGYGNLCDGDYNQDMISGVPDFATFLAVFSTAPTSPPENGADHNCDGIVGLPDLTTFKNLHTKNPGPSGLVCAGSIPCQSAQ